MELIGLLVSVLLVAAAFWGMMYVVDWMKIRAPFDMFARVIVGIIMLAIIIGFFTGHMPVLRLKL